MQRVYHKLQEWIVMLDSPGFKDNDAGLVREEMLKLAGEVWMNRVREELVEAVKVDYDGKLICNDCGNEANFVRRVSPSKWIYICQDCKNTGDMPIKQ